MTRIGYHEGQIPRMVRSVVHLTNGSRDDCMPGASGAEHEAASDCNDCANSANPHGNIARKPNSSKKRCKTGPQSGFGRWFGPRERFPGGPDHSATSPLSDKVSASTERGPGPCPRGVLPDNWVMQRNHPHLANPPESSGWHRGAASSVCSTEQGGRPAFSLVELLVVLAVIGILLAILTRLACNRRATHS